MRGPDEAATQDVSGPRQADQRRGQLAENEAVESPLMPLIEQTLLAWPMQTKSTLGNGCF